jgi:hypothetical protein
MLLFASKHPPPWFRSQIAPCPYAACTYAASYSSRPPAPLRPTPPSPMQLGHGSGDGRSRSHHIASQRRLRWRLLRLFVARPHRGSLLGGRQGEPPVSAPALPNGTRPRLPPPAGPCWCLVASPHIVAPPRAAVPPHLAPSPCFPVPWMNLHCWVDEVTCLFCCSGEDNEVTDVRPTSPPWWRWPSLPPLT